MSARLRDNVTRLFTSFAGKENQLVIPRPYINFCKGDILAALLLSQILYWSDRTDDQDGWFSKSYGDWHTELGMTEYQIKRAIHGDKRSKEGFHGLASVGVETRLKPSKHYGGAPVLHYRANYAQLSTAIYQYLQPAVQEGIQATITNIVQNGIPNIVQNGIPNIVQDQYTETTTETTTEKKIESVLPVVIQHQAPVIQSSIAVTPTPDLETLPDSNVKLDTSRIASAQAVKARLEQEGYQNTTNVVERETTPVPFGVARSLGLTNPAGMNWERHPYWQSYQAGGKGKLLETMPPSNIQSLIDMLTERDIVPDELETVVRETLAVREAQTVYRFSFVFEDVRRYRERQMPPPERDPALISAVTAGWRYAANSDASNKLVDFLSGDIRGTLSRQDWGQFQLRDKPMKTDELLRFIGWYKSRNQSRATPPETAKTLRERVDSFRATTVHAPSTAQRPTFHIEQRYTPTPEELEQRRQMSAEARARRGEGTPV